MLNEKKFSNEELADVLATAQDEAYNLLGIDSRPFDGRKDIVLRRTIITFLNPPTYSDRWNVDLSQKVNYLQFECFAPDILALADGEYNCHAATSAFSEWQAGVIYPYESFEEAVADYNRESPKISFLWNGIKTTDGNGIIHANYSCSDDEYTVNIDGEMSQSLIKLSQALMGITYDGYYSTLIFKPGTPYFEDVKKAYLKSRVHFCKRILKNSMLARPCWFNGDEELKQWEEMLKTVKVADYTDEWNKAMNMLNRRISDRGNQWLRSTIRTLKAYVAERNHNEKLLQTTKATYPTFSSNGHATILWTEAPGIADNTEMSIKGLDVLTKKLYQYYACEPGYSKMKIKIFFADGETYELRYDLGSDSPSIYEHIASYAEQFKNPKYARALGASDEHEAEEQYKSFMEIAERYQNAVGAVN